jgi:D-alanine transfer protein
VTESRRLNGHAHLFSALIALAMPIAILCTGRVVATYLEAKTIHAIAPEDLFIKNQGLALQRRAARTPNVLLLYGSSELADPRPNRAAEYFAGAPTGFQICPIGKPGASALTILQKIAAIGPDLRHRKVAIAVSPSFFQRRELEPASYAGNFSLWAASATIFGTRLDFQLKSEIANRMQQFPDTLAKSTLLQLAVNRLASGNLFDRMIYVAVWPLGCLETMILDLQDHFETLVYILSGEKTIPRRELRQILAPREAAEVKFSAHEPAVNKLIRLGPGGFRQEVEGAISWADLELLFRILQQFRVRALVLSMPFDGVFYDAHGISRGARQFYYDRMKALASRYGVNLAEFEDHDTDPTFQISRREHPTANGWLYYDRALDDFYHKDE